MVFKNRAIKQKPGFRPARAGDPEFDVPRGRRFGRPVEACRASASFCLIATLLFAPVTACLQVECHAADTSCSDVSAILYTELLSQAAAGAGGTTLLAVYVGTASGLSISTDGGLNFVNRTTANGLGGNVIREVYVSDSILYVATSGGMSISTDGGVSFVNRTTADGLGSDNVSAVYVSGSNVFAGSTAGLSISTDGGVSFVNRTTADGLGSNTALEVFVPTN